jgi:hypothetical protein
LLRWETSSAAEEAQKRLQELHRDGESNLRFPIIPTRVLILFEAFVSMITCSANNEARCGFDEIYVRGPGGFHTQQGSKPALRACERLPQTDGVTAENPPTEGNGMAIPVALVPN